MRLLIALSLALCCVPFTAAAAQAKPNVVLKLSGVVVTRDASGNEKTVPIEQVQPKPGDVIRFTLIAANTGDQAAKNLVPLDRIPSGTSYVAGSANGHAEFSLDGKAWSATPAVRAHTASGDVLKKADPATYVAVRWLSDKPLAPKSSETFVYLVRVK